MYVKLKQNIRYSENLGRTLSMRFSWQYKKINVQFW